MSFAIGVMVAVFFSIVASAIGLRSSNPTWWVFMICAVGITTAVLEAVGVY